MVSLEVALQIIDTPDLKYRLQNLLKMEKVKLEVRKDPLKNGRWRDIDLSINGTLIGTLSIDTEQI